MAAAKDKASGMKSAYELALERLAAEGIAPPDEQAVSEEKRQEIAATRQRAEAKLAELEILHRDKLGKVADPTARLEEERHYQEERRRIEEERERTLERLRRGS